MVVKCTFMKGDFDIKITCASLNRSLNASLNGTFGTFGFIIFAKILQDDLLAS